MNLFKTILGIAAAAVLVPYSIKVEGEDKKNVTVDTLVCHLEATPCKEGECGGVTITLPNEGIKKVVAFLREKTPVVKEKAAAAKGKVVEVKDKAVEVATDLGSKAQTVVADLRDKAQGAVATVRDKVAARRAAKAEGEDAPAEEVVAEVVEEVAEEVVETPVETPVEEPAPAPAPKKRAPKKKAAPAEE